jgi:hypothetical protein
LGGSGFESQQGVGDFFSSPKYPDRPQSPPTHLFNGVGFYFLESGGPGRDVDHSLPSSTEVKNEWSYTSVPPMCLYDVHGDEATFYFSCRIAG